MSGPFETAARAALEEILVAKCQKTRHGFVLTPESFAELVDELYSFLQTSRTLKEKGDRMIAGAVSGRGEPGLSRIPISSKQTR